ncbi:hypothetical protein GMJAKD_10845 [Candidatus Electrothrix aarhusensis]
MGLRDPKDKIAELAGEFSLDRTLQDLDEQAQSAEQGKWQSYKIEVITPIFGGGVKAGVPDTKMPIRASAIRGQLRYWWRFLAKAENEEWSNEDLFEKEREIWGGMAEEGEDYSSKVKIRIKILSKIPIPKPYDNQPPQYALFPAREQTQTVPPQPAKKLLWPDPNKKIELVFQLQLCAPKKNMVEVERVLRWWVTFGGIGARTRRGCGSIYCTEPNKLIPIRQEKAEEVGCKLIFPKKNTPTDAAKAWEYAVQLLHNFRQGREVREPNYGRSKWPEPDSIREIMNTHFRAHPPSRKARISFPRAAFGLPIVFKFKDNQPGEPEVTTLIPAEDKLERVASPLILKPYPVEYRKTGGPKCVSCALLLPHEHINRMNVELVDNDGVQHSCPTGKEQSWQNKGWANWATDWQNKTKMRDVDPIKNNQGTDALTAFMNFFARGGA